ncbi:putative glycerol-3-phosphate acyltransferase [Candidatus Hepatincola sp. Pdp]
MIDIAIIFGIGYFLGSLPYGFILVKIFKHKDIRKIGSKNIGATNVLRAGYTWLAVATLLADAFKGFLAVMIVKYMIFMNLFITPDIAFAALAGLSAIIGHMFPVWLKFKGGKGVATSYGTILAISPILGIIILIVWLVVAALSKYSSLAALLSFASLPIATYFLAPNLQLFMAIITLMVFLKHKENIKRLLNGTETKIKFRKMNETK